MKGKKGFSFAQVVLLAVVFALIFAWCAGAQAVPQREWLRTIPLGQDSSAGCRMPERLTEIHYISEYDKTGTLVRKLLLEGRPVCFSLMEDVFHRLLADSVQEKPPAKAQAPTPQPNTGKIIVDDEPDVKIPDPPFRAGVQRYAFLAQEVNELEMTAKVLRTRMNALQQELFAAVPKGYHWDPNPGVFRKDEVAPAAFPAPAAATPAPPVSTPTMQAPVQPSAAPPPVKKP